MKGQQVSNMYGRVCVLGVHKCQTTYIAMFGLGIPQVWKELKMHFSYMAWWHFSEETNILSY